MGEQKPPKLSPWAGESVGWLAGGALREEKAHSSRYGQSAEYGVSRTNVLRHLRPRCCVSNIQRIAHSPQARSIVWQRTVTGAGTDTF
jgi:hypothetical protein